MYQDVFLFGILDFVVAEERPLKWVNQNPGPHHIQINETTDQVLTFLTDDTQ